jgi:hypothetical protein
MYGKRKDPEKPVVATKIEKKNLILLTKIKLENNFLYLPLWQPKVKFLKSNRSNRIKLMTKYWKFALLKNFQTFLFSSLFIMRYLLLLRDILLNISYNDKIFRKILLEIREKFHFEILANFDHSKIFNSVRFKIS